MLIVVANNFAYVTICMFSLVRLSLQNLTDVTIIYVTGIPWVLHHFAMMYSIVHVGHYTSKEASLFASWSSWKKLIVKISFQAAKTAKILHQVSNEDRLGVLNKKVSIISQQFMHRIPVFSCGLFHFDLKLGFKVNNFSIIRYINLNNEVLIADVKRCCSLFNIFGSAWNIWTQW